jgi:excinuclease UvrABC nuclease subunit
VLYVGKAASLRSRLQGYMFDSGYSGDEFRDERVKWRWVNEQADKVAVWIWKCPRPLNALLELALISVFQPELNSHDVGDSLLNSDSVTILG